MSALDIEQNIRTALKTLPQEARKDWVKLDNLPYIHATDDPNASICSTPVVGRFDYLETADYMLACNPANMAILLAELEALRKATQWQPIESVSKDGTKLLLWEQYGYTPFVGWWLHDDWTVSREHVAAEGGWDGANVVDNLTMPVIYWMPLPALPKD